MTSAEFTQGLERLSIHHEPTLPYSPYQNGKQEHFWDVVEERFLAMLENMKDLTLDRLNLLFHAWIEGEYHGRIHSTMNQSPRERYAQGKSVLRPSPSPEVLRDAFRQRITRRVRRSDRTVTIDGKRYELPMAYRHHDRVTLVYARWAMDYVHLFDPRSGKALMRIFPQDLHRNASGERRAYASEPPSSTPDRSAALPPLLQRLLDDLQASGLPPAFLTFPEPRDANDESSS